MFSLIYLKNDIHAVLKQFFTYINISFICLFISVFICLFISVASFLLLHPLFREFLVTYCNC